jgi:hypothetical protein
MGQLVTIGIVRGGDSGAEGVPSPVGEIITVQALQGVNPCKLDSDISDCDYSSGGIQKMYFARRSEIAEYYFYAFNNRNKIKSIEAVVGGISFYSINDPNAKFSQTKVDTAGGPAFNQKIDIQLSPMQWQTRGRLRPFIGPVGHVCIYLDRNGRWWLAGEAEGLKNASRFEETGDRNGRNGYDISLSSIELNPIREIDGTWPNWNPWEFDCFKF